MKGFQQKHPLVVNKGIGLKEGLSAHRVLRTKLGHVGNLFC